MNRPFLRKDDDYTNNRGRNEPRRQSDFANGESEFYTGNKSKNLLVHIMQDGIEIDKPVKAKIYEQSVEWQRRQWPIVPKRFIYDYSGVAHQYVVANDVAVMTWQKDHEDNCKKCNGKMTIDARESRALGRRGVFHAIWGIDNTHMILLIVFAIGAMAMAGFGFWSYNQDTLHKTQLEASQKETARVSAELLQLKIDFNLIEPPAPETPPAKPR